MFKASKVVKLPKRVSTVVLLSEQRRAEGRRPTAAAAARVGLRGIAQDTERDRCHRETSKVGRRLVVGISWGSAF